MPRIETAYCWLGANALASACCPPPPVGTDVDDTPGDRYGLERIEDRAEPARRVRGRIAGQSPLSLLRKQGRRRGPERRRGAVPLHRRGRDRPRARPPRVPRAGVGDPATGLPIGTTRAEPEGRRRRRDPRIHRHVSRAWPRWRARKASTRSPTGSRRSPRPSARTPTATRRRSTRWSTERDRREARERRASRRPFGSSRHGEAMTLREGNLEAPTRHPIDWQSPDYYDEGKAFVEELERVFDICHGCRRCVSLCQSFPTLFDLVDATADGEVHGVDKRDYAKVVDQCYLCDLCYMTKCPYVPPHPWNVDFPHLMLRAKAIKFTAGRGRHGRKAARLDRRARPVRRHPDRRAGGQRGEPDAAGAQAARRRARRASRRLAAAAGDARAFAAGADAGARPCRRRRAHARARSRCSRPATSTTTSPASATTCSKVLAHNDIPYEVVEKESCCGMPKLELGDLDGVARRRRSQHPGAGTLRARGLGDRRRRFRAAR